LDLEWFECFVSDDAGVPEKQQVSANPKETCRLVEQRPIKTDRANRHEIRRRSWRWQLLKAHVRDIGSRKFQRPNYFPKKRSLSSLRLDERQRKRRANHLQRKCRRPAARTQIEPGSWNVGDEFGSQQRLNKQPIERCVCGSL